MLRRKNNRKNSIIAIILLFALIFSEGAFSHTFTVFADEVLTDETLPDEVVLDDVVADEEIADKVRADEEISIDTDKEVNEIVSAESENEIEEIVEIEEVEEIEEAEDELIEEAFAVEASVSFNILSINNVLVHTGVDFNPTAPAIGKAFITADGKAGNGKYYDATGTSTGAAYTLRVPRYVILHSDIPSLSANTAPDQIKAAIDIIAAGGAVSDSAFKNDNGTVASGALDEFYSNLALYDYTDGQLIDEDGYRVQKNNDGTLERIKVNGKLVYAGHRFEINELDRDVFKMDEALMTQRIQIPKSIISDIDYTFFSRCDMCSNVDVYFNSTEIGMSYDLTDRYVSSQRTDNRNLAGDEGYDSGVLLMKDPIPSSTINYKIVYCPPRYSHATYMFPFDDSQYGTRYIIGEHAFDSCEFLTKICWNGNRASSSAVINIDNYAFYNCANLTEPKIFDPMLERIGDHAFDGCTSLKNITLRQGNDTEIGKRAFYDTAIEVLTIPGRYRYINGESLLGMKALKKIEMSDKADEIENPYFEAKDGILYRKGAVSDNKIMVCFPALKEINYDEDGLAKLAELPYAKEYKGKENKTYMLPYDVTALDDYCFSNCENLENLILLSTLYNLEEHSIYGCKNLCRVFSHSGLPDLDFTTTTNLFQNCAVSNLNIQIFAPKYFSDDENKGLYNYAVKNNHRANMLFDINAFTFSADGKTLKKYNADTASANFVKDVFVPDFVLDGAGNKTFVTSVADGAFVDCNDITSVTILNHLQDIASGAFIEINNDGDKFPEKLVNLFVEDGNDYFMSQSNALYKVDPDTGDILELIFYPPSNTSSEFIAAPGLQSLPRYAFRGAKFLEKIKLYEDIVLIGKYEVSGNVLCDERSVFEGCDRLYEIDILETTPKTTQDHIYYTSDDGVLYRWSNFEHALIYYPKGERKWLENGHNGGTYRVLDGCETISDVNDVKELTTIYIPKTVTEIKDWAFSGTNSLRNVYISQSGVGDGLKTIGKHAFDGCDLVSLTLPYTLETIGDSAFTNMPLKYLVCYTDNLTSIGDRAFSMLSELETVDFIKYDSESNGQQLALGVGAFSFNPELRRFEASGVQSLKLGDSAFMGDASLKEFKLNNIPVTSLGTNCFNNCRNLENIDLSYYNYNSFTSVPQNAFFGCTKLFSVALPQTVTTISDYAFYNCNSLDTINFYELNRLSAINKYAFKNCNFKQVNFNGSVGLRNIMQGVFEGNDNLTAIYIPETVTNFHSGTFENLTTDTIVYTSKNSPAAIDIINRLNGLNANDYENPYLEIDYEDGWKGPKVSYGDILVYSVLISMDDDTPFFKQSIGATKQLNAQVVNLSNNEPADQAVKWRSLNPEVLSVDENGLVTLESDEYVGIFYIEAISVVTGDSRRIAIEVKDAAIYINGENIENAYVTVNCRGKNKTSYINATVNPTRTLYYKVVEGEKNIKVNSSGMITGRKRGAARVKIYAKEGDGSDYPTYMEAFVNVYVVAPVIEMKGKTLKIYGDRSDVEPIDHTKGDSEVKSEISLMGSTDGSVPIEDQTANDNVVTDYTHGTVTVKCYSVGPKGTTEYCVDNTVTWKLPDANVAYMIDEKGREVTELVTEVGGDKNLPNESSVEVYSAVNSDKSVNLYATYNGITRKIKVRVLKITTSIRPLAIDIYNVNGRYKLKKKIVGPDKKNLTWSFFNANGTPSDYITNIDKKGYINLSPSAFDDDKTDKTVYVYLTANGVTSDPAEINIKQVKTKIKPEDEEKNTIVVGDKKYLFLNSKGNNVINVFCDIEGPDLKKVEWKTNDKTVFKVKGKQGIATLTGVDSGKAILSATANGVTDTYPVMVVDTYTEFTSPSGVVLDLSREYKESDYGNKLSVRINGTDSEARIIWASSDEKICKIKAIDSNIAGEKKRTYDIARGGDYGYKRAGKVELEPVAPGKCTITATANGLTATYTIEVKGTKKDDKES